jgi:hypothetical protein
LLALRVRERRPEMRLPPRALGGVVVLTPLVLAGCGHDRVEPKATTTTTAADVVLNTRAVDAITRALLRRGGARGNRDRRAPGHHRPM